MIDAILAKIFGTKTEREVKRMLPTVAAINDLEPQLRELSDIDLAAKTIELIESPVKRLSKASLMDKQNRQESLTLPSNWAMIPASWCIISPKNVQ